MPPDLLAKARALSGKWKLPIQTAVQIAKGNRSLSDVLEKEQLKERVAGLVQRGELYEGYGGQVVAGSWPMERALFLTRLRERKQAPDYMRCYLDDYARDRRPAALALLGNELLQGTVLDSRPYDITFETQDGESLDVSKHDIKFYFDARRKKHLLKTVRWGDKEASRARGSLARVGTREDVKARDLLELQEGERAIGWSTVEGDVLRGLVTWFGRYEVVLTSPKGEIVALRHGVASIS